MGKSKKLIFNVAGLKINFVINNPLYSFTPVPKFSKFLCDESEDVKLVVRSAHFNEFQSGTPVFFSNSWSLSLFDHKILLKLNPFPNPSHNPIQAVVIDQDGHHGEAWVYSDLVKATPLLVPPIILDEILMVYLMARGWGVMLHSCGIRTKTGHGLLFSGVSGTGKSTTARLWLNESETGLLSDERVSVRKRDGKFWIFATPWNSEGQSSAPGCAQLDHLFIIKHEHTNKAHRLLPNEALVRLLPQVFLPNGDAQGLNYTLEFLADLVKNVPCYELGFVPDLSMVDYVRHVVDA